MTRDSTLPAVLLVGPGSGRQGWTVAEVDTEMFGALHIAPESDPDSAARQYATASGALDAAYDLLTLLTEGRMPATHEHVQESVQEFVRALEARGYDRESAVRLLLRMVDTMSERVPAPAKARTEAKRAS